MSLIVANNRHERGQVLQNEHGQYFVVCVTCNYEFVTIATFINHQNVAHNAKESQNLLDDLTEPKRKNVGDDAKESPNLTDDSTEPEQRSNGVSRVIPQIKPPIRRRPLTKATNYRKVGKKRYTVTFRIKNH